MNETVVLLIQLGTPDSPSVSDVRKYLSEFLNDPRVIDLPWLARKLLVNGIIVPFRAPKSAKIYQQLWKIGNGTSPLLTYSNQLKEKLTKELSQYHIDVELAMRYQNPSMEDVLLQIKKKNYKKIILLPLFPQYASASTGSAFEKAFEIIKKWWVIPEIHCVHQFYNNEKYLEAVIAQAKQLNLVDFDHILFSYHGLPVRQVDKVYEDGLCKDHNCENEITEENKFCYKACCYETTRLLAKKLQLNENQYTVCFQSRLDKNWLEPFSDKVIVNLAKKGNKKIAVFSPAFVADCLETIIEIGEEYQILFKENGGEKIQLIPSVNADNLFVDALKELVLKAGG
ncbi:MAG: ferrochelatase [Flavobacteriia bacterium]|nr:ferrochelatase [Flavobacteriia bacterium]